MRCPQLRSSPRSGAAIVEFAIIAPVLFLLIFGIFEFGRAMMVLELMNNAAREGCRQGTLAGSSTADVESVVTSTLSAGGITSDNLTVTVYVNNTEANPSGAKRGDSIKVRVRVPYLDVSYLPTPWFLQDSTLESVLVMRHE